MCVRANLLKLYFNFILNALSNTYFNHIFSVLVLSLFIIQHFLFSSLYQLITYHYEIIFFKTLKYL
jgi:hypothetical protein